MKRFIKNAITFSSASAILLSALPLNSVICEAQTQSYLVRDPFYNYDKGYNYYESEHFQFIWGNSGESSRVTEEFLKGNSENLEACWDVYMNEIEMEAPSQSTNISLRDGNHYKTNIYISGTGLEGMTDDWAYMSYDKDGYAYMFCCVDSMQYNPPSWVLPHEFGHVVTAHQLGWNTNKYSYAWWESMGNWFREQYLYSDYSSDNTGYGTDFFETYLKNLNFTFPCGRDYYAAWPFLQYLTENPDNLSGYGKDFVKTMLQEGQVDEYPFDMVDRLAEADLKDTLGHFAKRMAGLDFENGDSYRARLNELLNAGSWNWQQIYTMLEPVSGEQNTYQVPTERAPQFAGINIIPLETVSHSEYSVTINSLTDIEGADWRACIVQQSSDGTCRYSELFSDSETINVASQAGMNEYLVVIATPDSNTYTKTGLPYGYDSEFSEDRISFNDKERYPYSVTLSSNATIKQRTVSQSRWETYHNHSNGGGLVSDNATVDESVYVAPRAMVMGSAKVTGNVKVLDNAVVQDNASVSENAVISGYAIIAENAQISGNARVDDYAMVMGKAKVSGNAKVIESACVYGNYTMTDYACAKGMAFCMADGSISGQGVVDGDYYDDGNKTVSKGTAFGWVSSQTYVDALDYTDKLIYAYDFNSDSSNIIDDRYSSTYGYTQNNPVWEKIRTSADGVLTFNGSDQYAQFDRSILYTENLDLQLSVLPRSDREGQTILYLGSETAYIKIISANEKGCPEIIFCNGDKTEILSSDTPLALGEWSVIRVILDGDNGRLMINNQEVSNNTITINPSDIANSINTLNTSSAYRLSADFNAENNFKGSVDFLRIYNNEATAPTEIYTEKEEISSNNNADVFDLIKIKNTILSNSEYNGEVDFNSDNVINIADAVIVKQIIFSYAN